jgi:hypothetical protein
MRGRRRWLVGTLTGMLCCAALAPSAHAAAYLRDFQTRQSQTSASTSPVRTFLTGCPVGKIALGTGASALPGASGPTVTGIGLHRMWLTGAPVGPGVLLSAVEADPETFSWLLFAQTQCAALTDTRPTPATGGPYIKDVTVVSSATARNSLSPKDAAVSCGPKQSIGGGFGAIDGTPDGPTDVAVRRGVRIEGGFRSQAHETDPTGASWSLVAYAICANVTQPGTGYVSSIFSTARSTPVNSSDKVLTASCPSTHRTIGGGAEVLGGTATSLPPGDVVLTVSRPTFVNGVGTGWIAAATEEDPIPGNWHLRVRVVCGAPVPS